MRQTQCRTCGVDTYARGLCAMHYYRLKRAGSLPALSRRTRTVKRDCQHPLARHQHGTKAAYNRDKCGCDRCLAAAMSVQKQRRKAIAYGRHEDYLVPALGFVRRVQALYWLGHPQAEVARRLGTNSDRVARARMRPSGLIERSFHEQMREVYEQMIREGPPGVTPATARARNHARRQGFVSPWAWDDIDNDKKPTGARKAA